jgi:hypothetical protein
MTPEEFAAERSHRDAQVSSETARATAQAAILINGGAATAVLAFLSKGDVARDLAKVEHTASWCLAGYVLGVAFGALMMLCVARQLDEYHVHWRVLAQPGWGNEYPARDRARRWWYAGHVAFAVSIALFVGSSWVIAWALAQMR